VTAQTLDTVTPTDIDTAPRRKPGNVERARFPLVWKLFLMTASLIAIVVAVAVGITIQRANVIARTTVNNSISSAAKLFEDFERQRLGRLALAAQIVGGDSTFTAYIQLALTPQTAPASAAAPQQGTDLVSIIDQITQRRESLGSDLVMLLDDQGHLVAGTDQPAVTKTRGDDLYEQSPLVKKAIDASTSLTATGVFVYGNKLYHAAVAPIAAGANQVRVGYLINAYAIDDAFANKIAQSTNAGVAFVPKAAGAAPARSSNAPSVGMQQMEGVNTILRTGKGIPPSNATIEKSSYVMVGEPLMSANVPVGAAVFLRSLDRELAPFREIQKALLAGGGGALLLAFLLSWVIARRLTRPIEELAGIAQAVTAGDLSVHPAIDRSDEVGILGRSFAKMITSLRDKSELEELYEQMAAKADEREEKKSIEAPAVEEGTVLVTDLRGLPPAADVDDAANVIGIVTKIMKLQEAEVARQDGYVREIVGHRLVSVFRGDRGVIHAIRAARAINEEVASNADIANEISIGVGIATGQFVTGSVELKAESGVAIVGNAPLLASLFAWHSPAGYAYLSYETAQAAGGEILATSTREEVRLKWIPQPLPVAAVPLVGMATGVMRSLGSETSAMTTLKMDGTVPGPTSPAGYATADLSMGSLFANRYRIEQILGRGGMGVVYRATDAQLDETVAIKTLPGDVMQRSPEDLERFKREIRLARKITHRNVLRTYDYGEAEGVYFISMEYVRGYTLNELLDEAE
jgi:serine/threonine-protein kinase